MDQMTRSDSVYEYRWARFRRIVMTLSPLSTA